MSSEDNKQTAVFINFEDSLKDIIIKAFNQIEEKEITLFDLSEHVLYIDGNRHITINEKETYELNKHHLNYYKMRESDEWKEIQNLYNQIINKCIKDGIDYNTLKSDIDKYGVTDDNICYKYAEFEIIDKKFKKLAEIYDCGNVYLRYMNFIINLKKYNKIEWKYIQKIDSKVYYFKVCGFDDILSDFIDESALLLTGKARNYAGYQSIIFNNNINTELYNLYLEIKEDKNN